MTLSTTTEHIVFLSSGSDLDSLRDRVTFLMHEVVNPTLVQAGIPHRVHVDRWERTAAGRTKGETANEEFVARALHSEVTIVLIQDRLGPGTEEELDGVVVLTAPERPELAVFRFRPSDRADPKEIARIDDIMTSIRERIIYKAPPTIGAPDDEESWYELIRQTLNMLFRFLNPPIFGAGDETIDPRP